MRETFTALDPEWGTLLDVDVLASGDWAGVFLERERLFVRTAAVKQLIPQTVRFPMIRCISPGRVVLANTRSREPRSNAWIIDLRSDEVIDFVASDAIADILANRESILVTYFDEGVYSGSDLSREGVNVFDHQGRHRAGYRTTLGDKSVDVGDCYAACWVSERRITFFPYTDFPLVTWDLETLEQEVVPTPARLHGSSAISMSSDGFRFFSPYKEKATILAWKPGSKASVVGTHAGRWRGLRGGRFLSHGPHSFTILE